MPDHTFSAMTPSVDDLIYSPLARDADLAEIVDEFVREIPVRLDAMQHSWACRDWQALGRAVHQLKGAAGSYGFPVLSESLKTLHRDVLKQDPETVATGLNELLQLCRRLRGGVPEEDLPQPA